MLRRDALKLMGLTGLAAAAPLAAPRRAQAQVQGYDGPLLLSIHASGGWDTTSLCDPKGQPAPDTPGAVNHYLTEDIRVRGDSPIQWAPFGENDAFFERYRRDLLVINGVDMATNSHDAGTRYAHSGSSREGQPALAALWAGAVAQGMPLGYITNGGYDVTRGVVSRARVSNVGVLADIAHPNRINDAELYHDPAVLARINEAQVEQAQAYRDTRRLSSIRASVARLLASRSSENLLGRLTESLPDLNGFSTELGQQGAMALASYSAGLTAAANLMVGGFDTHGNHDVDHATAMIRLTRGIDEIWREVERRGLEDRVILMIGSDFNRTPRYNDGDGKDHWSIGSMMFMGAGIRGNRVVGATTADVRALTVHPETLALDPEGITLTPAHIHRALRDLAGLSGTDLDRAWPLQDASMPSGETLPLFA